MFMSLLQFSSYVVLLILGIIVGEYLINYWQTLKNVISINTPVPDSNVRCSPEFYSASRITNWAYSKNGLNFNQELQTPIQRIPQMKHLRLEYRAKIMKSVRRRLDKQF